jgi:hypothetical protein
VGVRVARLAYPEIFEVVKTAHPAVSDIEIYLMAAARSADEIDHLFAAARDARDTCISNRLH